MGMTKMYDTIFEIVLEHLSYHNLISVEIYCEGIKIFYFKYQFETHHSGQHRADVTHQKAIESIESFKQIKTLRDAISFISRQTDQDEGFDAEIAENVIQYFINKIVLKNEGISK
jgi:hypothetical protein